MNTMMNEALEIAAPSLALIEDLGFQNEFAQVRAHAVLENLGVDSSQINWTYHRRGLERNGTAGVFSIETAARLDPSVLDEPGDLPTAALRMAQLWEALAAISQNNSTALLTAAASYELAGYQANSATIAQRLRNLSLEWAMAPLVVDFLRRRVLSVVAQQEEHELSVPSVVDPVAFVTAAADRLLGRALTAASHYLLGGQPHHLDSANTILERARAMYARAGRSSESTFCATVGSLLPVIARRTTWSLMANASATTRWQRYLKLLGRGTARRAIDARSLSELWPSQIRALQSGLVSTRGNLVIRLPTSAGKTRIAEIAIAHQLSEDPGSRCIYVAPYRALVAEVEDNFTNLLADLGVRVASFAGAYDDDWFEQQIAEDSDLIIATPERLDLIDRTHPELLANVRLVVLDEGQTIGDATRGARFELLIARLRARLPSARVLVMSAVVPQETLEDFASWLQVSQSSIVQSDWRPSVQRVARFEWRGNFGVMRYEPSDGPEFPRAFVHGLVESRTYAYNNLDTGRVNRRRFPGVTHRAQTAAELALHFSRIGPVLIFCPQTNHAESAANALESRLELSDRTGESVPQDFIPKDTPSSLTAAEWLGADHKLVRWLRRGIGIHYGRLPDEVRSAIENDFREMRIPVLVATSTLAQGVNLPVRTVIVHSVHRQDGDRRVRMPAREYWNIAGRAGRAGFETEGMIVHITFNANDEADFRYYQSRRNSVEPVNSALFELLMELTSRRISSEEVSALLNPDILALMTEESPEEFDQAFAAVMSKSMMATQAARRGVVIEPLVDVMKQEAVRMRQQVPDWDLLTAYRSTGLSSNSCLAVSALASNPDFLDFLRSGDRSVPRNVIEVLIQVVSVVPEFTASTEPPVNYVDATERWLLGSTVSEIEHELLGSTNEDNQLGRFAGEFFVHTLPWAASVMISLAKHAESLNTSDLTTFGRSFPSMLRFGVPSPEAAWCMSLGIGSRRAAIIMAADYRSQDGIPNYISFRDWFASIEPFDLRSRYSLEGRGLENAIRAIRRVGVSSLEGLDTDVSASLPIDVQVVGTQYEHRWVPALELSARMPLTLRREIDNAFDRNAILVLSDTGELGYLPRRTAQHLAPEIDAGLQLSAEVVSAQQDNLVVRIQRPNAEGVPNEMSITSET